MESAFSRHSRFRASCKISQTLSRTTYWINWRREDLSFRATAKGGCNESAPGPLLSGCLQISEIICKFFSSLFNAKRQWLRRHLFQRRSISLSPPARNWALRLPRTCLCRSTNDSCFRAHRGLEPQIRSLDTASNRRSLSHYAPCLAYHTERVGRLPTLSVFQGTLNNQV
jgi:hypothetical protein